jgi:NADPH:quinone reductase-like Zn-dependent oxidoreductase
MRVVCLRGGFGLEHLTIEERPDPEPGPNELLLGVRAAALNFRDVSLARGTYDRRFPEGGVLGSDAVGEVLGCGPGVTRFALGDRVCPIIAAGWHEGAPTRETPRRMLGGGGNGTLAERLVVHEDDVVRPPVLLSDEEASTLGCAGVTAYRALFEHASTGSGSRVLVIGTGGVSSFAIQLAQAAGAQVLVVSRDEDKLVRALELGAAQGIFSPETPQWGAAAREIAGGDGVDVVVEVGGAATLEQSLRAVRAGGTVAFIGHTPGESVTPSLVPIVMREIRLQGVLVGPKSSFEALVKMLETTSVRPVVDHVFKLDDVREAFEYQASGIAFGKIVVRVS